MSLNNTPASERIHIGIFGNRNAGKSSIINAVTGQDLAIVSDVKGTTTDPVYKAMELLPLGPVVIIDTPGLDDDGALGAMRIKKAHQVLNKTDIAVLVVDATKGIDKGERELIERIERKNIPYIVVYNKTDLAEPLPILKENEIAVSAKTSHNINALKELLTRQLPEQEKQSPLVSDLLTEGDMAVLVIPIDKSAPKGRLILPQQQTIRDILQADAVAVMTKETKLSHTLNSLGTKPKIVITDSQIFPLVASITPADILLTSFSILFARYKGSLADVVQGARAVEKLKDGDKILISEGCSHHRQCEDIGTVKLPRWIADYTGKKPEMDFTSGTEFPDDLSRYRLVVHCGGCMLNEREMKYRLGCAKDQNVPMTNYGILIAYMNGILKRSVQPFEEIYKLLEE